MTNIQKITTGVVVIALAAIFIQWTGERDQAIIDMAETYEICVMQEYGTTPIAWRAEHGEYPSCNISVIVPQEQSVLIR